MIELHGRTQERPQNSPSIPASQCPDGTGTLPRRTVVLARDNLAGHPCIVSVLKRRSPFPQPFHEAKADAWYQPGDLVCGEDMSYKRDRRETVVGHCRTGPRRDQDCSATQPLALSKLHSTHSPSLLLTLPGLWETAGLGSQGPELPF